MECRIVACDRPQLLQRAIKSLQAQSYPHWKGVVFDDSRTKTAEKIVKSFREKRIVYRWNKKHLGSTGNLNQGFARRPFVGGSFAFVLEDDNALEKQFIQKALEHIKKNALQIVSMNQRIAALSESGTLKRIGVVRRNQKNIRWDCRDLLLNAFCGNSLPNGGYFWKIGSTNLEVDELIREPQLQECVRQTLIKTPILLAKEIGSIWSFLPENMVRRNRTDNRRYGLMLLCLSKCILKKYSFSEILKWIDVCDDSIKKRKAKVILARVAHATSEAWVWGLRTPKTFCEGIIKNYLSKKLVPQGIQEALDNYAA